MSLKVRRLIVGKRYGAFKLSQLQRLAHRVEIDVSLKRGRLPGLAIQGVLVPVFHITLAFVVLSVQIDLHRNLVIGDA